MAENRTATLMQNAARTIVADCIFRTSVRRGDETIIGFSIKSHDESDASVVEQLSGEVAVGEED